MAIPFSSSDWFTTTAWHSRFSLCREQEPWLFTSLGNLLTGFFLVHHSHKISLHRNKCASKFVQARIFRCGKHRSALAMLTLSGMLLSNCTVVTVKLSNMNDVVIWSISIVFFLLLMKNRWWMTERTTWCQYQYLYRNCEVPSTIKPISSNISNYHPVSTKMPIEITWWGLADSTCT